MNLLEKKMVELLSDLKENHHVVSVKAEFEAEGTRMEEAMRLKEISMKADLPMTLKIGGCEAIKDMFEAASLGVAHLVAPMVETPYALKKFLSALDVAFCEEARQDTRFYINVETLTAVQNLSAMLELPNLHRLSGIVVGRVDLTGSMGLARDSVNSPRIREIAHEAAEQAHAKGLDFGVGGGVSFHSIPFFRSFPPGRLTRFETRKVVFSCPGALANDEAAFLKAVEFELTWLRNKQNHYGAIRHEDDQRVVMMEACYRESFAAWQNSRETRGPGAETLAR